MSVKKKPIPILSSEKIRALDQYTIENEPINSIDLMERASKAFVAWFVKAYNMSRLVKVFCGTGNNGGDGLAISRLLLDYGYSVQAFYIGNAETGSEDFKINRERLIKMIDVINIKTESDFPEIENDNIVIDGIFGSGLSRPVVGIFGELIEYLNRKESAAKIAIDIPSGLFDHVHSSDGAIFMANHTISFQVPKLAFFMPQNDQYCGHIELVDIGLHQQYLSTIEEKYYLVDRFMIKHLIKKRPRFMHKGLAGKCLIVSGSEGKMGAVVLATRACMRAGAGLVTAGIPKIGLNILQTAVPEAMVDPIGNDLISLVPKIVQYDAIGIGPGMGTHDETQIVLKQIIDSAEVPLVIDADALNIISTNLDWLELLPRHSILTPHPGEFKRLVGEWENDFDRLNKQVEFSIKYAVVILLKGAFSSISTPEGHVYFNPTGNPGMATGGSGDVLTGIITSLMGQGYNSVESSLIGGYLHGLSGDLYVEVYSEEGILAGDLIDWIPRAFSEIKK